MAIFPVFRAEIMLYDKASLHFAFLLTRTVFFILHNRHTHPDFIQRLRQKPLFYKAKHFC